MPCRKLDRPARRPRFAIAGEPVDHRKARACPIRAVFVVQAKCCSQIIRADLRLSARSPFSRTQKVPGLRPALHQCGAILVLRCRPSACERPRKRVVIADGGVTGTVLGRPLRRLLATWRALRDHGVTPEISSKVMTDVRPIRAHRIAPVRREVGAAYKRGRGQGKLAGCWSW